MERGSFLVIGCCAWYLAWWVLAFRPVSPITGLASGWLLLPSLAFGVSGVYILAKGIRLAPHPIEGNVLIVASVAVYLLLLFLSRFLLHRPVTTELFLIIGWALLTAMEINALSGLGVFSPPRIAWASVIAVLSVVVSLVCYFRYYGLEGVARYIDGMIPLFLVAVTESILSLLIIR